MTLNESGEGDNRTSSEASGFYEFNEKVEKKPAAQQIPSGIGPRTWHMNIW